MVGPSIGPCCYEVGPEVSARFDAGPDRATASSISGRRPSGRSGAPGVATVERLDLCTRCNPELFFSHRRTGARARRAGGDRCCRRLRSRARYARVRAEVGAGRDGRRRDEVRVARGHGGSRRGRDRGGGGEPRAGSRGEARRVRRRVPLALHRPAPVEQGEGREPLLRARALARLALGGGAARDPGARCR